MSMFDMDITSIQDAVMQLKNIKNGQEFSSLLAGLRDFLKTLDTSPQCLMERIDGDDLCALTLCYLFSCDCSSGWLDKWEFLPHIYQSHTIEKQ